jgi:hypothetical protein
MGDVFILLRNFNVPLGFKVGCPSSDVDCDVALVFIFLCVGLMVIFLRCCVFLRFPFYWCVFCCFLVMVWCVLAAGGVFACSGVTVCHVLSRLCCERRWCD